MLRHRPNHFPYISAGDRKCHSFASLVKIHNAIVVMILPLLASYYHRFLLPESLSYVCRLVEKTFHFRNSNTSLSTLPTAHGVMMQDQISSQLISNAVWTSIKAKKGGHSQTYLHTSLTPTSPSSASSRDRKSVLDYNYLIINCAIACHKTRPIYIVCTGRFLLFSKHTLPILFQPPPFLICRGLKVPWSCIKPQFHARGEIHCQKKFPRRKFWPSCLLSIEEVQTVFLA